MRDDAQALFGENRFMPSESVDRDGQSYFATPCHTLIYRLPVVVKTPNTDIIVSIRYSKHNVFSCELDGHEWEVAPHLLAWTRELMLTLPSALNESDLGGGSLRISEQSYGTKLAVALGDGSAYPRHVDNACVVGDGAAAPAGALADARALTVIYYLNPSHRTSDGGQLRLWATADDDGETLDAGGKEVLVEPMADTLVAFFADSVVHDVLPNHTDAADASRHRYALTLWLVSEETAAGATRLCDTSSAGFLSVFHHFPPDGD